MSGREDDRSSSQQEAKATFENAMIEQRGRLLDGRQRLQQISKQLSASLAADKSGLGETIIRIVGRGLRIADDTFQSGLDTIDRVNDRLSNEDVGGVARRPEEE